MRNFFLSSEEEQNWSESRLSEDTGLCELLNTSQKEAKKKNLHLPRLTGQRDVTINLWTNESSLLKVSICNMSSVPNFKTWIWTNLINLCNTLYFIRSSISYLGTIVCTELILIISFLTPSVILCPVPIYAFEVDYTWKS